MNVDSEKIKNLNNWIYRSGNYRRSNFRQSVDDLGLRENAVRNYWKAFFVGSRKKIIIAVFVFVGLSVSGFGHALGATLFEIPFTSDGNTYNLGTGTPGLTEEHALAGWKFLTGNGAVKSFLFTDLLQRVGNPIDSLNLSIYKFDSIHDATTSPDGGTLVATANILGTDLPNSATANIGFTFTSPWLPSGTSTYSLVFSRTGIASTTNYYQITNALNAYESAWAMAKTNGLWLQNGTTKRFSGVFYSGTPVSDTLATSAQAFADAWNNFTSSTWNCSNSTSTSGQGFTDALGCAFTATGRQILNFMFVPGTASRNAFSGSFGILSSAFPFSLFFDVNDLIQSEINTGDFSTNQALKIPIMVNQYASTTINITSSTFTNIVGSSAMGLWFEFQKYLAWAIVMFLIFMILFKR